MAFFAFHLDRIHVKFQRGKVPDNDVVTFGVFINQIDHGHGAGLFPDLVTGAEVSTPFILGGQSGVVRPDSRVGMSDEWIIGPLEIAPSDGVTVVYSGTNISDSNDASAQQQADVEIKILDTITSAVISSVGGPIAAVVGGVLGAIGDPIGKLLGIEKHVCNGLVFSDAVPFVGSGLENLPFRPTGPLSNFVPNAGIFSFTRSHTDEITHDTGRLRTHRRNRCYLFGSAVNLYTSLFLDGSGLPRKAFYRRATAIEFGTIWHRS